MLPQIPLNINELEPKTYPNLTFKYNPANGEIDGMVDGYEAIKQSGMLNLYTENQAWNIYGPDYGASLEQFIGKPYDYVAANLESAIKTALSVDDRFIDISNFKITRGLEKDSVVASLTAKTILGNVDLEVGVRI